MIFKTMVDYKTFACFIIVLLNDKKHELDQNHKS